MIGCFLYPLQKSLAQKKAVKKANLLVAPFGFTFGQNEKDFHDKARSNNALPKNPYMEPGFRDMRRIVFPVMGMPMGSRKANVYALLLNNMLCQLKVSFTEDSLLLMKELTQKYGTYQRDTTIGQNRKGYRWQFDNGYLLATSEFRNEFYLTYAATHLSEVQLKKMREEDGKPKPDSAPTEKAPEPARKDW